MEMYVWALLLAVLGASLGSFASATAWRLHKKKNITTDRSECEHCHHKLSGLDLIPILSWVFLRGKCRYCRRPIRRELVLTELSLAGLFMLSYAVWPFYMATTSDIFLFALWLLSLVLLTILFLYDLKWMLLPDKVVFPLIGVGGLVAIIRILESSDPFASLVSHGVAVLVLSGLYLVLFLVSKGRWVGFGDVKLGLFLGLALGSWSLALLCLFLANFIGCLIVLPGLLSGKMSRQARVPFGPLLIAGFVLAMLFGQQFIGWYLGMTWAWWLS